MDELNGVVPIRTYTAVEVGEMLQIPPERVRKYCKEGDWPHLAIGRTIRFTQEQVDQIVELLSKSPLPRVRVVRRIHTRRPKEP